MRLESISGKTLKEKHERRIAHFGIRLIESWQANRTLSGTCYEQGVPIKFARVLAPLSMGDEWFPVGKHSQGEGEGGRRRVVWPAAEETQTRGSFLMSGICAQTIMTIRDAATVPCDQQ